MSHEVTVREICGNYVVNLTWRMGQLRGTWSKNVHIYHNEDYRTRNITRP
jgi:hypothetical protein